MNMNANSITVERVRARARELGFELAGVADVRPSDHEAFYRRWLEEGHHGGMGYLAREDAVRRRMDLRETLEGVRSAVVVAHPYFREDPDGVPDDPSRAVVARYARGDDYHVVMEERLEGLLAWIRAEADRPVEGRVYVDTGPILERELAQRAGIGWFGKNTMMIHPRTGSFFFLGVVLLELELETDAEPVEDHCGTCSACLEACPTAALLGRNDEGAPVMNARRCISYLTIEHRGPIPRHLRPLIGNRVYGCDICQEVCPWNVKFAEEADEAAYEAKPEFDGPTLVELAERLLPMSENGFLREYEKSPISRARRKGLLRNVCVGLGNWLSGPDGAPAGTTGGPVGQRVTAAVDVLVRALNDGRPLVRGHAAWALGRVPGASSADDAGRDDAPIGRNGSREPFRALTERLEVEEDEWVREECERALSGSG